MDRFLMGFSKRLHLVWYGALLERNMHGVGVFDFPRRIALTMFLFCCDSVSVCVYVLLPNV
jgi:hypothetical protein